MQIPYKTEASEHKHKNSLLDLSALAESLPGGAIKLLYDGKRINVIYMSEGLYNLFGYTKDEYDEMVKKHGRNGFFILLEYEDIIYRYLDETVMSGTAVIDELRLKDKSGKDVWIQIKGIVISRGENGVNLQFVVIDITKLKKSYFELQREREKMNIIIDMSADMLFEYDIINNTMYYDNMGNNMFTPFPDMENYQEETLRQNLVHPDDIEEFMTLCEELKAGKADIHSEFRKKYADNIYHWVELYGHTLFDAEKMPYRVIGKVSNIDERKEKEEWLRNQSERDLLTNLYNSGAVIKKMNSLLGKIKNETGALFIIDIDNFKNVNDSLGRMFGDAVICSIADELRTVFRGRSIYGRIGGDEFAAYIRNTTDEIITETALRFRKLIENIYIGDTAELMISCSIGIARYPDDGTSYDELCRKADSALYFMKMSGKKGHYIYTDADCSYFLWKNMKYLTGFDVKREAGRSIITNPKSIVLFALELLDKTKDINSAINMIFDRLSRYFNIEEIELIRGTTSEKPELVYIWRKDKGGFSRKDTVSTQDFYRFVRSRNDEKDIDVYNDSPYGDFLSAAVSDTEGNTGYMLFFHKNGYKKFDEAKQEIKGISSLLAGHIFRMQESKRNSEYLNYLLNYDALTGFPNYSRFLQLVEQEITLNMDVQYYVMYCDFTNFKYINEAYGYNEGDAVLKKFGQVLQKECFEGIYFTRINSDKFAILLKGYDIETHRKNFIQIARQFCAGIKKDYNESSIVIIGGISELDKSLPFVSSSVDRGNIARKSIKNLGESDCAVYNGFLQSQTDIQMEITRHMEDALVNSEFVVYLQPKIDLQSEQIVGGEALVRWQKNGSIIFYPDSFIPLFEQNGFVTKLDYYVLEQVLIWMKKAIDNGEDMLPISLNFSRRHQKEEDFVEHVVSLLNKYHIPSEYIEAEITESIFMSDLELLNNNLRLMKESGILVSIDDFGSGYSSLNVLASVSADIIKLDKAFLKQMNEMGGIEFLGHLIMMIKQLGFKVIAEGVETEEQKLQLLESGCDMAQGYYYAKPMPIEQFQSFVKEHNKKLSCNEI